MLRPFLEDLTPIAVLTGAATVLIVVTIRLLWRRGKSLEDL